MKYIPKEWLVLIAIIILTLGIGIYDWNKTQLKDTSDGGKTTILTPPRWSNQNNDDGSISKEEGDVTVLVEYMKDKSQNNNMVFQITLDTHSVDLDSFDFQQEISLEKDGKILKPLQIYQSGSIHHRKAEITFAKVTAPITVALMNLSGIPRREFKFTNLN